jgi:hypothetical protein
MPRWAATIRRFHCISTLPEAAGGPLGRLLVLKFDGLVGDVLWRRQILELSEWVLCQAVYPLGWGVMVGRR